MNKTDRKYFEWLVSQIDIPVGNPNTYNDLFAKMHGQEFFWTVPNDDNRVGDGAALRDEFLNGRSHYFGYGVSILEVLIALSRRLEFIAAGKASDWAWQLLENLRLNKASDPLTGKKADNADDILYALVWRTYSRDGQGGFFPLVSAKEDQRKVEVWYQMNAYVIEIVE
jgi:hypothetical protein